MGVVSVIQPPVVDHPEYLTQLNSTFEHLQDPDLFPYHQTTPLAFMAQQQKCVIMSLWVAIRWRCSLGHCDLLCTASSVVVVQHHDKDFCQEIRS